MTGKPELSAFIRLPCCFVGWLTLVDLEKVILPSIRLTLVQRRRSHKEMQ
jgi:hypothetical protein